MCGIEMREEPATRQFRSKPILIIHFVVWLALAVYVFHMIMPMVTKTSFGILYQSSENGEFLRIKDFQLHFNFVQKHGGMRQQSPRAHRSIQ
jgi:hypothetical protein